MSTLIVKPGDVLLCRGGGYRGGEFLRTVERLTATTCTDVKGTTWHLRTGKARGNDYSIQRIATPDDIARVTESAELRALRRKCCSAMDWFQRVEPALSRERLEALLAALESAMEDSSP